MLLSRLFLRRVFAKPVLQCCGVCESKRMASYSVEERGSPYSLDYKVYFRAERCYISPFHDIPLYATSDKTVLNMVVEVPRWTNAKMEISKEETLNPIKQDVKKEKPRFVNNCFPYHGYIWNYGAFPQTWEDPGHVDPNTNAKGDNDPLDVCEIGYRVAGRGEVKQVKVLGTIALIDEGETDWKILAIDVTDPLASKLNDVSDIEKHMPGFLNYKTIKAWKISLGKRLARIFINGHPQATVQWFKIYKMPTGKPPNQFAFEGEAKDKAFATRVIEETHAQWRALIDKKTAPGTVNCANTTVTDSPYLISHTDALNVVDKSPPLGPPAPIDPQVDKWYFVSA